MTGATSCAGPRSWVDTTRSATLSASSSIGSFPEPTTNLVCNHGSAGDGPCLAAVRPRDVSVVFRWSRDTRPGKGFGLRAAGCLANPLVVAFLVFEFLGDPMGFWVVLNPMRSAALSLMQWPPGPALDSAVQRGPGPGSGPRSISPDGPGATGGPI